MSRLSTWQRLRIPAVVGVIGVLLVALSASTWIDARVHQLANALYTVSPFAASFVAPEVFREIGIALTLAAIATMSIEAARVREFSSELAAIVNTKLEEIEKTASDAILRGPLPKSYYEHVKRLMLLKLFLRNDWRMNMVFTVREDCFEIL